MGLSERVVLDRYRSSRLECTTGEVIVGRILTDDQRSGKADHPNTRATRTPIAILAAAKGLVRKEPW
jgi:hypothetical protein